MNYFTSLEYEFLKRLSIQKLKLIKDEKKIKIRDVFDFVDKEMKSMESYDNDHIITQTTKIRPISKITMKELKRLWNNEWINDEIINYFGFYFNKKYSDIYIFTTYDALHLNFGLNNKTKYRFLSYINDKDKVFIPFHVNECHWILGIIDFKKKSISLLDSLYYVQKDNEYYKKLDVLVKLQNNNETFKKQKFINYPKQNDTINCGIFTLMYMMTLVRKETKWMSNDPKRIRYFLLNILIKEKGKYLKE